MGGAPSSATESLNNTAKDKPNENDEGRVKNNTEDEGQKRTLNTLQFTGEFRADSDHNNGNLQSTFTEDGYSVEIPAEHDTVTKHEFVIRKKGEPLRPLLVFVERKNTLKSLPSDYMTMKSSDDMKKTLTVTYPVHGEYKLCVYTTVNDEPSEGVFYDIVFPVPGGENWSYVVRVKPENIKREVNSFQQAQKFTKEAIKAMKDEFNKKKAQQQLETQRIITARLRKEVNEMMVMVEADEQKEKQRQTEEAKKLKEEKQKAAGELKPERLKQGLLYAIREHDIEMIRKVVNEVEASPYASELIKTRQAARRIIATLLIMENIDEISKELNTNEQPAVFTHDVIKAFYLLLSQPETKTDDWDIGRDLLDKDAMIELLDGFNVNMVHPAIAARAQEILDQYTHADLHAASEAVRYLIDWIKTVADEVPLADETPAANDLLQSTLAGLSAAVIASDIEKTKTRDVGSQAGFSSKSSLNSTKSPRSKTLARRKPKKDSKRRSRDVSRAVSGESLLSTYSAPQKKNVASRSSSGEKKIASKSSSGVKKIASKTSSDDKRLTRDMTQTDSAEILPQKSSSGEKKQVETSYTHIVTPKMSGPKVEDIKSNLPTDTKPEEIQRIWLNLEASPSSSRPHSARNTPSSPKSKPYYSKSRPSSAKRKPASDKNKDISATKKPKPSSSKKEPRAKSPRHKTQSKSRSRKLVPKPENSNDKGHKKQKHKRPTPKPSSTAVNPPRTPLTGTSSAPANPRTPNSVKEYPRNSPAATPEAELPSAKSSRSRDRHLHARTNSALHSRTNSSLRSGTSVRSGSSVSGRHWISRF